MSEWERVIDTPLGANGADGRLIVARRKQDDEAEWGVVFYRGINKRAAVKVAAMGSGELRAAAESNPEIERRTATGGALDAAIALALDRPPGDSRTRSIILYVEGRLPGGGIGF